MSTGRLFAVVGPSGAGKDTLLAGLCATDNGPHWVRRVITRPESAGGEPFEGVSRAAFELRSDAGEFALSWDAHGLSYGIPARELEARAQGRDVVFNGSRGAMKQAQAAFPDLQVIVITAPIGLLAERLAARGRETKDDIKQRLKRETAPLPEGLNVIEISNDASIDAGIAKLRAALYPNRAR